MRFRGWIKFNVAYLLGRPRWDTQVSPPELLRFISENPPGRALDLGCGTGTNLLTLAKSGWQVTGVDFAYRAIALARQRLGRAGLKADIRLGDVTDLSDIKPPFDLVLDIGCFHGLSKDGKNAYVNGVLRLLADRGYWLLFGFRNEPGESGFGIDASDIEAISKKLELVSREDSLDIRGHPATWLLFAKNT